MGPVPGALLRKPGPRSARRQHAAHSAAHARAALLIALCPPRLLRACRLPPPLPRRRGPLHLRVRALGHSTLCCWRLPVLLTLPVLCRPDPGAEGGAGGARACGAGGPAGPAEEGQACLQLRRGRGHAQGAPWRCACCTVACSQARRPCSAGSWWQAGAHAGGLAPRARRGMPGACPVHAHPPAAHGASPACTALHRELLSHRLPCCCIAKTINWEWRLPELTHRP